MSCEQFEELVHELVRLELWDTSMRDQAFAHARCCAACSTRLAQAEQLAESCEVASLEAMGREAPARVEAALLTALRRQYGARRFSKHLLTWGAAAAAAAVLALAGWVLVGKGRAPVTPAGPASRPHVTGPVVAERVPQALPDAGSLSSANADAAQADPLANFVPLAFADDSDPDGSGIIVRVKLTRAALGQLGYRVEPGKGNEVVEADVWMGDDGWPRAVRIAQ
jgi:hypothetical protein